MLASKLEKAARAPWRITFEWVEADAWRVDLEQYH
jgi:plasmid maintenance system killer protein